MDAIPSGLVDPQVGSNHYMMSPFDADASGDSIASNPSINSQTKNEAESLLASGTAADYNAVNIMEGGSGYY